MFFTELVLRLRQKATSFNRNIGSTSAWEMAQQKEFASRLPLPYCFVLPGIEQAQPRDEGGNQSYQLVTENFFTILAVDNSKRQTQTDETGQKYFYNVDSIQLLRQELLNALLDWQPIAPYSISKFNYVGGRHLDMFEGKLYHEYEWQIQYYVDITTPIDPDALLEEIYFAYFAPGQEDGSVLPEDYFKVINPDDYLEWPPEEP